MTDSTPALPSGAGSRLVQTASRFERELAAQDVKALSVMTRTYRVVIDNLGSDLRAVEAMIAARQAEGRAVPVSWLHKQQRYKTLILNARDEFNGYGASILARLDPAQEDVIRLAQRSAIAQIEAALPGAQSIVGSFHSLPENAVQQLKGTLQAGSPLRELLDGFGDWGSTIIEDTLTYGLARGMHPSQITKAITDQLDICPKRTALIVRTELYRSYREANRGTYAANAHVVDMWIWNAHLGSRSCAACLAMHGTEHPLSEPMGSHPNCRCTMLPKTKTWADLGFSGIPETGITGADVGDADAWLRSADERTQRKAFGNNKVWQGWKDGKLKLPDVVRTVSSPDWGITRTIAGSKQAYAQAARRSLAAHKTKKALPPVTPPSVAPTAVTANVEAFKVPKGYESVANILAQSPLDHEDAIKLGKAIRTNAAKATKELTKEIKSLEDEIRRINTAYGFEEDSAVRSQMLNDLRKAKNRLLELRNGGFAERERRAIIEELRKVRPGYGTSTKALRGAKDIAGNADFDAKALAKLQEQAEYFPKEWWDDFADNYEVITKFVDRGYFYDLPGGVKTVEVMLSGGNPQATALHELFHFAEHTRAKIRSLEHDFYHARTKGETLRVIPGHSDKEKYKPDKFHTPYMGKSYGMNPDSFYEVGTMTHEVIFSDIKRHTVDDEMQDFILGILAGV